MHRFRSRVSLLLCVAVFASLFSGFAASAAPLKPGLVPCGLPKLGAITIETGKQAQPDATCCTPLKTSVNAPETKQPLLDGSIPCCVSLGKLPTKGKVQIGVSEVSPCPPAPADETCGILYPEGAVVGEIPFDQQAYYEPGLIADGVTINAGTYWVTGLGKADNGDEFYQIVIACQLLFVPANDIVPSYQSPWSGQPLPTTEPIT
jgi:hypothetical protein